MVDFNTPYKVMKKKGRKSLEIVVCKHEEIKGELRETSVKGRSVIGSLTRFMRGRNVSREVKKKLNI